MSSLRVGVLRGGPSSEYAVSLKTGAAVLRALSESDHYSPIDIFVDRNGVWHMHGTEISVSRLPHRVDLIVNAMHGGYGEDGKVEQLLEHHALPYTGSRALPSALAMNKMLAKKVFRDHGLRTPLHTILEAHLDPTDAYTRVFATLSPPYILKPVSSGSSQGVFLVHRRDDFTPAFKESLRHGSVMAESFIRGREATVGVIEGFRSQELYALPPVEIIPPHGHDFFNAAINYSPETQRICPGNFSREEKAALEDLARRAHRALGLRHYSRSDFILARNGIYLLEVNSLPGLTEHSLFPRALEAIGSSLQEFLEHIISLVRGR